MLIPFSKYMIPREAHSSLLLMIYIYYVLQIKAMYQVNYGTQVFTCVGCQYLHDV